MSQLPQFGQHTRTWRGVLEGIRRSIIGQAIYVNFHRRQTLSTLPKEPIVLSYTIASGKVGMLEWLEQTAAAVGTMLVGNADLGLPVSMFQLDMLVLFCLSLCCCWYYVEDGVDPLWLTTCTG